MSEIKQTISVQKTGGFAGLSFKFEQQIAVLNAEERNKLEALIYNSGLRDQAVVNNKSKNARDVFTYSFVLREDDTTYSASFDDTTLTPAYRELFQYVQNLSASR